MKKKTIHVSSTYPYELVEYKGIPAVVIGNNLMPESPNSYLLYTQDGDFHWAQPDEIVEREITDQVTTRPFQWNKNWHYVRTSSQGSRLLYFTIKLAKPGEVVVNADNKQKLTVLEQSGSKTCVHYKGKTFYIPSDCQIFALDQEQASTFLKRANSQEHA